MQRCFYERGRDAIAMSDHQELKNLYIDAQNIDYEIQVSRPAKLFSLFFLECFKYGLLLNHDYDLTDLQIDQILSDALTNCEGFYPSLQKVVWGGASPSEAIGIAMMPTQGEA